MEDDTEEGSKRTYISPPSKRERTGWETRSVVSGSKFKSPTPLSHFCLPSTRTPFFRPRNVPRVPGGGPEQRRYGRKKKSSSACFLLAFPEDEAAKKELQGRRAARGATRIPAEKGEEEGEAGHVFFPPISAQKKSDLLPLFIRTSGDRESPPPGTISRGFFSLRSPARAAQKKRWTEQRAGPGKKEARSGVRTTLHKTAWLRVEFDNCTIVSPVFSLLLT